MAPITSISVPQSRQWADRLGTWTSALCLVHCLLTPALLSFSAVFAHFLPADESVHRSLAVLVALFGTIALIAGFRRHRRRTVLFLMFAIVALLLASIGLFATISRAVSERTHEIGIRTALGASDRHIMNLVFGKAALPMAFGVALGLAGFFVSSRFLEAQLVNVSPADPESVLLASAVMIVSAILGCVVPVYRALHVDPVVALRHE